MGNVLRLLSLSGRMVGGNCYRPDPFTKDRLGWIQSFASWSPWSWQLDQERTAESLTPSLRKKWISARGLLCFIIVLSPAYMCSTTRMRTCPKPQTCICIRNHFLTLLNLCSTNNSSETSHFPAAHMPPHPCLCSGPHSCGNCLCLNKHRE